MRRAATAVVLSSAAMVALAACGGGSSSAAPSPTPPNPSSFSFNWPTPAATTPPTTAKTLPLARKINPGGFCHTVGQHGVTSKDVPYTCVGGHWVADKVRP